MCSLKINADILDQLIVGRVDPHIYAFTTPKAKGYLKVGDTSRPVKVRIKEWKDRYDEVNHIYTCSARIDENTIFRDFSVHRFLENEKSRARLRPGEITDIPYYSCEFFKGATTEDIDEAIADIRKSAVDNDGKNPFYTSDRLPRRFSFVRGEELTIRPMQQRVIDSFISALNKGRDNLLMYAVMRFGKSFTSMCCAKEMGAGSVIVVSAKADVEREWQKTVESIGNFKGYVFANKSSLLANETLLSDNTNEGKKTVVFLTLQDLQGEEIKECHKQVFSQKWDLLIVDETHFGARAEHYGKVLLSRKDVSAEEAERQLDGLDTLDHLEGVIKSLKRKVTIHLSGTPYRILMGSEFSQEDVIAFVQFPDIVEEHDKWIDEHKYDDGYEEWSNPYFGFPKQIRFAFMPNQSSIARINQLKSIGATSSFSEMFRPESLSPSTIEHERFKHEDIVLDFLKAIDGSKQDANVLGFLDNDRIKNGDSCRHIVIVLPYCASCDALQHLIANHKDEFIHLKDYVIVNISGVDREKRFSTTDQIKSFISSCDSEGKKTITLTVNRMLTGSTVPEWDTMLFLKQSSSPEEYDQAIFRLQNPHIETFVDAKGDVIKINKKPETLLIDFDPQRVFKLQERKCQIYNINTDKNGNSRLRERIDRELNVSPIIILDHNKLREVSTADIIDAVREYSATRSVMEEASEVPVDLALLENDKLRDYIGTLTPINSRKGICISAVTNDGDDEGDDVNPKVSGDSTYGNSGKTGNNSNSSDNPPEDNLIGAKLASYYAFILFFAFLTEDAVTSLEDIINSLDREDNKRISDNLGLNVGILKLIQNHSNGYTLQNLDYKIQNINSINCDESKTPLEKVNMALTKFGRISDSEVVTPMKIAEEMVSLLPENVFSKGKVLDLASKQGEFAIALIARFGKGISDKIFSICTSPLAYEFTRKIYKLMGLPLKNIFSQFYSIDIIKEENKSILQTLKDMNFSAVIGNPPYHLMDDGAGVSAKPIYNDFVKSAQTLTTQCVSLIMPSRWFIGGKGLDAFRKSMLNDTHIYSLYDYPNFRDVFPNADIAGGVCHFLWNREYDGKCHFVSVAGSQKTETMRSLNQHDILVRDSLALGIIDKISQLNINDGLTLASRVSSRRPFGLPTNYKTKESGIPCWFKQRDGKGFASEKDVTDSNEYLDKWKFLIPRAPIAGQTDFTKPVAYYYDSNVRIAEPGECCTETYLVAGAFDSREEVLSYKSYIMTKIVRYLISQCVISQDVTKDCFAFVPDLSKYEGIFTDERLCKLWHITDEEWRHINSRIRR